MMLVWEKLFSRRDLLAVITDCAEYKAAVEGRVIQRAECKPIDNSFYMKLKR